MREENESKTRKQLERTISGLKVGRSPNLIFHWELSHCGKTRISWAQSCCFLSFYRSPLLWGNSRDASNWIRPSVWRIHYFHIAHDALCPATFCINIASISPGYYSRPLQYLVWGEAGGVNMVHYGRWENVEWRINISETNRCKTQEASRIWITHLFRTVPDLVKTSLLSMRALCTSISIFWPLEKLRAFQLTLAFTVALSGWCC